MPNTALPKEKPLVSIIMPTYNSATFIRQSIDSVLKQTYPLWELIIVDDASTDQTETIVQTYSNSRIRYHRLTNRTGHPSAVRNIGLGMSQGQFIGFLDSDDEYYPTALEILTTALMQHPDWWIAQGYETLISEDGRVLTTNPSVWQQTENGVNTYRFSACHRPPSLQAFLLCHNPCLFPASLVRRQVFEQLGLYNEALLSGEDQEYFLRLYLAQLTNHPMLFPTEEKKVPVGMVPAFIFQYRQRANSLVHSIGSTEKAIEDNIKLLDWFFSPQQPLPPNIRQLAGKIYANRYSYASQALLLTAHHTLSRKWIFQAWQNQRTSRRYWILRLLPILLGSYIPVSINRFLARAKDELRHGYYRLSSKRVEMTS